MSARLVLLLVFLGVVGCGAAPHRTVSARADDPPCPAALKPTEDAPERVIAATRRELRRAFPDLSVRGASIRAVAGLSQGEFMPELDRGKYTEPAVRACGRGVTAKSWIAVVWLPSAPSANFGAGAVYVARTRSGWKPWLVSLPFDGTGYRVRG